MNWFKLIANVGGVLSLCFGAHVAMTGGAVAALNSPATWFGVALCLASNIAGLIQQPPQNS